MEVTTLRPGAKINIVRPRPRHPEVLLAWEFGGVRTLDLTTGTIGKLVANPEGTPEVFVVDQWYVDPTGAWSLAMSHDERGHAIVYDHHTASARRVDVPDTMGLASGNAWFDDDGSVSVVTFDGLTWRFDGEGWALAEPSEAFATWSKKIASSLDKPESYAIFKTDMGAGHAYLRSQIVDRVGIVSIPNGEVLLVPGQDDMVDVAGYGPTVLVAFADDVRAHRQNAEPRTLFEAGPDESILEIVSHRAEGFEYLVVLCDAWNESASRLHVIRRAFG